MNSNPFSLIHFSAALFHGMLIYPFVSASTISPGFLNVFFLPCLLSQTLLHRAQLLLFHPVMTLPFSLLHFHTNPICPPSPHHFNHIFFQLLPYSSLILHLSFFYSLFSILFYFMAISYTKILWELNSSLNLADCTAVILLQKLPGVPRLPE